MSTRLLRGDSGAPTTQMRMKGGSLPPAGEDESGDLGVQALKMSVLQASWKLGKSIRAELAPSDAHLHEVSLFNVGQGPPRIRGPFGDPVGGVYGEKKTPSDFGDLHAAASRSVAVGASTAGGTPSAATDTCHNDGQNCKGEREKNSTEGSGGCLRPGDLEASAKAGYSSWCCCAFPRLSIPEVSQFTIRRLFQMQRHNFQIAGVRWLCAALQPSTSREAVGGALLNDDGGMASPFSPTKWLLVETCFYVPSLALTAPCLPQLRLQQSSLVLQLGGRTTQALMMLSLGYQLGAFTAPSLVVVSGGRCCESSSGSDSSSRAADLLQMRRWIHLAKEWAPCLTLKPLLASQCCSALHSEASITYASMAAVDIYWGSGEVYSTSNPSGERPREKTAPAARGRVKKLIIADGICRDSGKAVEDEARTCAQTTESPLSPALLERVVEALTVAAPLRKGLPSSQDNNQRRETLRQRVAASWKEWEVLHVALQLGLIEQSKVQQQIVSCSSKLKLWGRQNRAELLVLPMHIGAVSLLNIALRLRWISEWLEELKREALSSAAATDPGIKDAALSREKAAHAKLLLLNPLPLTCGAQGSVSLHFRDAFRPRPLCIDSKDTLLSATQKIRDFKRADLEQVQMLLIEDLDLLLQLPPHLFAGIRQVVWLAPAADNGEKQPRQAKHSSQAGSTAPLPLSRGCAALTLAVEQRLMSVGNETPLTVHYLICSRTYEECHLRPEITNESAEPSALRQQEYFLADRQRGALIRSHDHVGTPEEM
ncbi:hypothetical protein cyc_05895 [Cyclospora cayetanensis]|uniref:Uncharacterized protein n=1 Tax=Cyclospora cayetanensis TaxID=88456 RepID=A0A1D3D7F7_9EIME|nr:hypothetical protein cyc_05895 [Cyclospora cayetanensis]